MNTRTLFAAIALALSMAEFSAAHATVPDYVAKAVADPSRPADDRKLDADRRPAEVIAYAEVKPGQTIGEYLPGGGYYTRLLSDIVGPSGKI